MNRVQSTVIVDWGTTNFRAFRFDPAGELVQQLRAPRGILAVDSGDFAAALQREIGDWLEANTRILFSGMITSRNGWVETPYIPTPATLDDLARQAITRPHASGATMLFLPGVAMPLADVMRGEEIQVFGACEPQENVVVVLPGTHSKWVRHEAGCITAFHTFMTGEVFAALKEHTILGRLVPSGAAANPEAFRAGLAHAREYAGAGLLHSAFSARSKVLLGAMPAADIEDYLSGLVIGAEFAGGLALGWQPERLVLVGEAKLTARYAIAAEMFGMNSLDAGADATIRGFRRLAAFEGSFP